MGKRLGVVAVVVEGAIVFEKDARRGDRDAQALEGAGESTISQARQISAGASKQWTKLRPDVFHNQAQQATVQRQNAEAGRGWRTEWEMMPTDAYRGKNGDAQDRTAEPVM